jgi:hypothetical protein
LDVNINFVLIQEMDVKANQIVSASSPLVQQVLVIHDLGYVLAKHYSDYVLEINMGIKQDRTPLVPLELDQVGISPPKEKIHGSILWSNASINENMTIDLIMNAMTSIEVVLHIFQ